MFWIDQNLFPGVEVCVFAPTGGGTEPDEVLFVRLSHEGVGGGNSGAGIGTCSCLISTIARSRESSPSAIRPDKFHSEAASSRARSSPQSPHIWEVRPREHPGQRVESRRSDRSSQGELGARWPTPAESAEPWAYNASKQRSRSVRSCATSSEILQRSTASEPSSLSAQLTHVDEVNTAAHAGHLEESRSNVRSSHEGAPGICCGDAGWPEDWSVLEPGSCEVGSERCEDVIEDDLAH